MKICLYLILVSFALNFNAVADEVSQKTDGSFSGEDSVRPINSSFIGADANSVDNSSFAGEDVHQATDGEFVGTGSINAQNSYFAGESYQEQVGNATLVPFAQDNTETAKDSAFIGEDVHQKTEGTFIGSGYGK
jgi:hypothetical protein